MSKIYRSRHAARIDHHGRQAVILALGTLAILDGLLSILVGLR